MNDSGIHNEEYANRQFKERDDVKLDARTPRQRMTDEATKAYEGDSGDETQAKVTHDNGVHDAGKMSLAMEQAVQQPVNANRTQPASFDGTTFEYLKPTDVQMQTMEQVRSFTKVYAAALDTFLPAGADKTYVLRKVREIGMWANVAITREANGAPRSISESMGTRAPASGGWHK